MSICSERGWFDGNQPICVACQNPIMVRGDNPRISVLVGEVIECSWSGGTWVAHFHCRKEDWWSASPARWWYVRTMGQEGADNQRTYVLLTSRPDWAEKEPQIVRCRVAQKG